MPFQHLCRPAALLRRPCILIGSAFGTLLSLLLLQVLPSALDLQPGVYAVVGATAMLGATFRSSISLVVIVVEGTRGIGQFGLRERQMGWLGVCGMHLGAMHLEARAEFSAQQPSASPCRAAVWCDTGGDCQQLGGPPRAPRW